MASANEDARSRGLGRSDRTHRSPVAGQNGRVFKRTGDGAMVEFRSVVEAVRCATEIQNAMAERNSASPRTRRSFPHRHSSRRRRREERRRPDGRGVNIAARLEGVAKPGAICLSEDAYRQVRSRLDLRVSDSGRRRSRTSPSRCASIPSKSGRRWRGRKRPPSRSPSRKALRAPQALAAILVALLLAAGGWFGWRRW